MAVGTVKSPPQLSCTPQFLQSVKYFYSWLSFRRGNELGRKLGDEGGPSWVGGPVCALEVRAEDEAQK